MKLNIYLKKFSLPIVMLISLVISILLLTNGQSWGGDFAAYILQAFSISENNMQGFIDQNEFLNNESSRTVGPYAYPWGFPLLLVPPILFLGFNIYALKFVIIICFQLYLVALWYLFRRELYYWERVLLICIFAFNPSMLLFLNNILSDIPFLAFSTLALLTLRELKSSQGKILIAQIIAFGCLSFIASTIRANGILLILTYAIATLPSLLFKTPYGFNSDLKTKGNLFYFVKWGNFIYFIPFFIYVLGHCAVEFITPRKAVDASSELINVNINSIFDNIAYYAILLKDFFGPIYLGNIIFVLTLPFFLLGVKKYWKRLIEFLIFGTLTIMLYVVWPFQQGLRFLFPIIPIYIFFMIIGLRSIKNIFPKLKFANSFPGMLIIFTFMVLNFGYVYKNLSRSGKIDIGPFSEQSQEMFNYIKINVPDEDIVVFRKPRVMRLFTGKPSLRFDSIESFKYREWYVLDKNNAYILDDLKGELFLKYPVKVNFENSQFIVYRFLE